MAETMGLGVVPWSPQAGGVLTGKYGRSDLESGTERAPASKQPSRKDHVVGNGFLTERGLDIAGLVKDIATEIGTTPSRVALAWTRLNPAVVASLLGARTLAQLDDNLGALEVELEPKQRARLEEASTIDLGFPYEAIRRLGLMV